MENQKMILTRKIQLLIDTQDKVLIQQVREQLYNWQWISYRSANMIMSHQFVQEHIKDFFYLTEEIKFKLADQQKEENGILTSSRQHTTYKLLSRHFKGQIPTNILSNINHSLISTFNKEKTAYWKGEKSLRNYKKNIAIPFGARVMTDLSYTANQKDFKFKLFNLPFRTYLGKDKSDKKIILERIHKGTLKLCTSKILLDKGKIYLLAAIEVDQERHELDSSVIAEASLSLEHPVIVKIGQDEYTIGHKEEFLHRRMAIRSAIIRVKKAVHFNKSGQGNKRKKKVLDNYQHQERKYVEYKLHVYSRKLIDLCVKYQAATLLLVNQEHKEEVAKQDVFLLQNWSYYSLKEKIAYKANRAGIQLIVE